MDTIYYEAHVTFEPIFDEDTLEIAKNLAASAGYKVADLYMLNHEASRKDTFMTKHSKDYDALATSIILVVDLFKDISVECLRYKIESVVLDSRYEDKYKLIGESDENINRN
jgi:hypothetical protein